MLYWGAHETDVQNEDTDLPTTCRINKAIMLKTISYDNPPNARIKITRKHHRYFTLQIFEQEYIILCIKLTINTNIPFQYFPAKFAGSPLEYIKAKKILARYILVGCCSLDHDTLLYGAAVALTSLLNFKGQSSRGPQGETARVLWGEETEITDIITLETLSMPSA